MMRVMMTLSPVTASARACRPVFPQRQQDRGRDREACGTNRRNAGADAIHAAGILPPAVFVQRAWEAAADYAHQGRAGGELHVLAETSSLPDLPLHGPMSGALASHTNTAHSVFGHARWFALPLMLPSPIVAGVLALCSGFDAEEQEVTTLWRILFVGKQAGADILVGPRHGNCRDQHLSRSLPKWAPLIDYWIIGIGEECPPKKPLTWNQSPPDDSRHGHPPPSSVEQTTRIICSRISTCACQLGASEPCACTSPDSNNTDDSAAVIDKHLKHIPGELMVVEFDGMGPTWTKIVERGLGEPSYPPLGPVRARTIGPRMEEYCKGVPYPSRLGTELNGIQNHVHTHTALYALLLAPTY